MHDRDGFIWFDGDLIPWREAKIHVLTHSLHYGVAVFEGLRAYPDVRGGSSVFRLDAHVRRFFDSARAYRMPLPLDEAALAQAIVLVLQSNRLDAAYVRPIAFYGSEKLGVSPRGARVHVSVAAFAWGAYLGDGAAERGIRVKTSSFARPAPNTWLSRAKISASYANSLLASVEAADDGYDEALMLDTDGFVAEGPGENVFMIAGGRLHEPEPTSALPGITREVVRRLACDLGLEVVSRRLLRDDLYLADEAFFCGTAAELAPIVELDRRPIGGGTPGPITRSLADAFRSAVCGRTPRYHDLLHRVPAADS